MQNKILLGPGLISQKYYIFENVGKILLLLFALI